MLIPEVTLKKKLNQFIYFFFWNCFFFVMCQCDGAHLELGLMLACPPASMGQDLLWSRLTPNYLAEHPTQSLAQTIASGIHDHALTSSPHMGSLLYLH